MCSKTTYLHGELKEYVPVVFKYGGIWVQINDQHRKRCDSGKQRTVKFEKGQLTIFTLRGEIARICPWIKRHSYNMYYYIYGTSRKEYKDIIFDVQIKASNNNLHAEIVITFQEVEGHESISNLREVVTPEQMVECSFNHNKGISSAPTLCYKDIVVGTFFLDAKIFKHALRSVAIRQVTRNVSLLHVLSRLQMENSSFLCEDTQNFEIKRVCADEFIYDCRPLISLDIMLLHNLAESIGPHIKPLSFISDMEKGLGDAIREVYPRAEYRVCIHGHKLQVLGWAVANAYTTIEYNDKLVELRIYHATNTNNFAESFNAWIADARNKPVVELIDIIHGKLMEQRVLTKLRKLTDLNCDRSKELSPAILNPKESTKTERIIQYWTSSLPWTSTAVAAGDGQHTSHQANKIILNKKESMHQNSPSSLFASSDSPSSSALTSAQIHAKQDGRKMS
ncbi:hypothetical protein M5K25_002139 [Dendrobium thyrsiflorum]|uniref:Uncharacterized protein n=1 Tax=Dendrobium thyrsiflorum TaxID=117978 RepID=A0ABD0VSP4_DENTH